MRKRKSNTAFVYTLCLFLALAGVACIRIAVKDGLNEEAIGKRFMEAIHLASFNGALEGMLWLLILYLCSYWFIIQRYAISKTRLSISVLIAFLWFSGIAYRRTGTLGYITTSATHLFGFLLYLIGWTWILYMAICVIDHVLKSDSGSAFLSQAPKDRKFGFYFFFILLAWVPYIVILEWYHNRTVAELTKK